MATTKIKPEPMRIARVLKETAGDGPSSYVIRIYDDTGCPEAFFDSNTLNNRAALEFMLMAMRGIKKVDKVVFSRECLELEELWKENLA